MTDALEALTHALGRRKKIGFDVDSTVFVHTHWVSEFHLGEPVPAMVDLIKAYIEQDVYEVVWFTARWAKEATRPQVTRVLDKASMELFGQTFMITNEKTIDMVRIYDDKAVSVEKNTGVLLVPPESELAQLLPPPK